MSQSLQVRFPQRVKRLREARGWSFTYLSVHSGLAKNTSVEVESGRTEPRLNTIAGCPGLSISPYETTGCPVLRGFGFREGRDSMMCPSHLELC